MVDLARNGATGGMDHRLRGGDEKCWNFNEFRHSRENGNPGAVGITRTAGRYLHTLESGHRAVVWTLACAGVTGELLQPVAIML